MCIYVQRHRGRGMPEKLGERLDVNPVFERARGERMAYAVKIQMPYACLFEHFVKAPAAHPGGYAFAVRA